MTPSRDELIPLYREAENNHQNAVRTEHQTRDARNQARDQLVAASRAEAADQIGVVMQTARGDYKIVRLGAHWLNAAIIYPILVRRAGKGWAKREHHDYGWSFDFELRRWARGTVDCDGTFKPSLQEGRHIFAKVLESNHA